MTREVVPFHKVDFFRCQLRSLVEIGSLRPAHGAIGIDDAFTGILDKIGIGGQLQNDFVLLFGHLVLLQPIAVDMTSEQAGARIVGKSLDQSIDNGRCVLVVSLHVGCFSLLIFLCEVYTGCHLPPPIQLSILEHGFETSESFLRIRIVTFSY